ncbi:MAG TPA: hypothetical protein VLY83_02995 [Methanoregula sp.]|nr:hypothetical protein [Methanoregula sp.]
MSRHPLRALDEAAKIAKKRGYVQFYERVAGMNCDFTITTPEYDAPVKIKRMPYLRCTIPWVERTAAKEIAGLLLHPSSKEISRELWLCSPEYAFRFLRVCDAGLAELGRDGQLLLQKSPAPAGCERSGHLARRSGHFRTR